MPAPLVLVHGLWHGAWCWDPVQALLDARGIASTAVDLPLDGFAADVAAVRGVLDAAPEPVVLAGHSYGGAVITEAGAHDAVAGLVYVAAFQLDRGESISRVAPDAGISPTRLGDALRFSADGHQVLLDPEAGREIVYSSTPRDIADAALARIRPVARSLFSARPSAIAWRERPSTYVVCTEDRCVAPDLQRLMAARAGTALEWPCDHSPLQSDPQRVADLLASAAVGA